MYQIYKIAYQISDEIKLRKENEKPFYWEQVHPEIREKTIEEIDQHLLGAGLSEEELKKMPKNEKYLAVSEGVYAAELADKTSRLEQLEQQAAIDGESRFLTNPNPAPVNPAAPTAMSVDDPALKAAASSVQLDDEDYTPLAIGSKKANEPGHGTEPAPIKDEPQPGSTTPGQSSPGTGVAAAGVVVPSAKGASTSIKRESMVIVKNAVDQMNLVERDPDSQAALVQSVIDELTKAKQTLYT